MPENWKTYKLSELTSVITKGTTPSTYGYKFLDSGINYIRAQSLNYNGSINQEVFSFISQNAHEKLKRSQLIPNDILFSMAGAYLGMVGLVKDSHCPANTNQAVGIIRIDSPLVEVKFVEYSLRNPKTIAYVNSQSGQSAQPNINLAEIGALSFKFPPLPEQRTIASILSSIDDKIENNLAMNKTLEDMAMALYKHWFVDFGPFQEGKFIDSELGEIPEGWEVKQLENLIDTLSKGTTPRKKDVDNLACTIPFLKVKDINDFGLINESSLEYIPDSVHNKQLKRSILKTADILISIAGTIGRTAIIPSNLDNANCNQALAFVRLTNKELNNGFIYLWINSIQTQNEIDLSIVQGVQANVSLGVLKSLKFVYPPEKILKNFNNSVLKKLEMISVNRKEIQTLTKLRDTLLPKLISGEVRLKEFEEEITSAL